jgi:hypothetical protein
MANARRTVPLVLAFVLGSVVGGASCHVAEASPESMMDRAVRALERIATALEKGNR